MGDVFVEGGKKRKGKEKEKGKGKKGKKEKKRKEREREWERERGRKGNRSRWCFDGWNSLDQEVKFVYSTRATLQEVGILPILVYFYHLGYCFGLIWDHLVPCLWHGIGL